ncbi:hypothetical protein [Sphingomonas sp. LT1P40]|uniref:hypothetical protein n=1 Tax=Alteristakelama amylovorans TaxID=3096166 RepID=UPI002FC6ABD0
MRNDYDDRFWAENHQVLSDGIDRAFHRLGRALARLTPRARRAPSRFDTRADAHPSGR